VGMLRNRKLERAFHHLIVVVSAQLLALNTRI